jgi:hypothetical protein
MNALHSSPALVFLHAQRLRCLQVGLVPRWRFRSHSPSRPTHILFLHTLFLLMSPPLPSPPFPVPYFTALQRSPCREGDGHELRPLWHRLALAGVPCAAAADVASVTAAMATALRRFDIVDALPDAAFELQLAPSVAAAVIATGKEEVPVTGAGAGGGAWRVPAWLCVCHAWVDARVFLNGAPVGGVGSYSACNEVTVGMRKSEVWGWVRNIRVGSGLHGAGA